MRSSLKSKFGFTGSSFYPKEFKHCLSSTSINIKYDRFNTVAM